MKNSISEVKTAKNLNLPMHPTYLEWEEIEREFSNRYYCIHSRGGIKYPYVQHGDAVDDGIVSYFSTVDEPVMLNETFVQCGRWAGKAFERFSEKARRIYFTFKHDGENWIYCGLCFKGETKHKGNDTFADDWEHLMKWSATRLKVFIDRERQWIRSSSLRKPVIGRNSSYSMPFRNYSFTSFYVYEYLEFLDYVYDLVRQKSRAEQG